MSSDCVCFSCWAARSMLCCSSAPLRRTLLASAWKRAQARLRSSGMGGAPPLPPPALPSLPGTASSDSWMMTAAAAANAARSRFATEAPCTASSASRRAASRAANAACNPVFSCWSFSTFSRASVSSCRTRRALWSSSSYSACRLRSCAPMSLSGFVCWMTSRRDAVSCSSSSTRWRNASASGALACLPSLAAEALEAGRAAESSSCRRDTSAWNRFCSASASRL
mmetsp:Transcript_66384/g.183775  ORF Transcript_66384/g.183775 Transcript_66384/m.183775 type:complete len:225 (+) Transcript_66384:878-1552(+)